MSLIHDRLDDVTAQLLELNGTVRVLAEQVQAMRNETVTPRLADHERRLIVVEAWRWKVVGAAAAMSMFAPGLAAKLGKLLGAM
jgi:hypothetical protein